MVVILISSSEDPAGTNIKNNLFEQTTWKETNSFENQPVYQHSTMKYIFLLTVQGRTIRQESIDQRIKETLNLDPTQIIFITRHRAKTGEPSLSVHPIGNYGSAEYGGQPKTLVLTAPRLMTHLLRLIKKNKEQTKLPHHVCFEVTHHGPYLETPTFFAEVGSTEDQWRNKEPGAIIAQSLLELLKEYHGEADLPKNIPVLIGIGGGHYAPRFTDIIFERKAAFGHMIPSYHLKANQTDYELFEKALSATPDVSGVYLHKKELKKSQVTDYTRWFKEKRITIISSKELEDISLLS
jgi:D-aminoacyl-tRNA deacylase